MPDIPPFDEVALALKVAEGDETAFTELYRMYIPLLTPFIYGITKSEIMVDEIVQETFLRLWMSRDKLSEIKNPRGWIFRITANICYTYLKRLILERDIVKSMEIQHSADDITGAENVDVKMLMQEIKNAVNALPPVRKNIYRMSREQGMTISEISAALNLSSQTVKNTLTTSLQSIRQHLQRKGYTISIFYILISILKNY